MDYKPAKINKFSLKVQKLALTDLKQYIVCSMPCHTEQIHKHVCGLATGRRSKAHSQIYIVISIRKYHKRALYIRWWWWCCWWCCSTYIVHLHTFCLHIWFFGVVASNIAVIVVVIMLLLLSFACSFRFASEFTHTHAQSVCRCSFEWSMH